VARALVEGLRGEPIKPFRDFDKGQLATIGRSRAVAGRNIRSPAFWDG
jgi:NADH dehydrogenase FAD-containing subunit